MMCGSRLFLIFLLAGAAPAAAQPSAPAAAAEATVPNGDAVAAAVRKTITERYVLPDVASKLDAALAKGTAAGRYRGVTGEPLATRINADLAAVVEDKHLGISYDPAGARRLGDRPVTDDGPPPAALARFFERQNSGVRELKLLPGNIRYFAYDGFAWGTPGAEAALAAAMQFLRGGDAYIIDLRRNGGGSPGAVAALASYFLPEGSPLMRFEMRGRAGEATRSPKAPFSLTGKPLYVLTSTGTASAAEEFATHVSAYGFGTLVGTRTAGAGFRNDVVPLPGGYVLSVSTGRAVSLKTGKDWERVGVAPAIETSVDGALARAQAEAIAKIAAAAPPDERAATEAMAAYYRALATPVPLARPVTAYAGVYGERTIAAEGNGLTFRRGDRPPFRLIPIAPDVFASEADPAVRVAFVTSGDAVTAIRITQPDGSVSEVKRN